MVIVTYHLKWSLKINLSSVRNNVLILTFLNKF